MTSFHTRAAACLAALCVSLIVAAAASAQSTVPTSFFNCRASAFYTSISGNDRVEPIVANGNPRTGSGRNPDFAVCADADAGAGSTATQLGVPPEVASARTANAVTSIDPDNASPIDQRAGSSASVEDLRLALGSPSVIVGAAAANSSATARCNSTTAELAGQSQLTGLTLGGNPVTLDELVKGLTDALTPLGPIVEITPNEQVRDATSLTVRALHVKVLRDAGSTPVLDAVIAESRVVAPAGVCTRSSGVTGSSTVRPCPPGSTLDAGRGVCLIRGEGPGGRDIIIGRPFEGPSGGRVDSLRDARKRFPNNPCVKGEGAGFVIIGTNGNDRITGTNGPDRIILRKGNDQTSSGRGSDCVDGGSGRDVITGGLGNDRLFGATGNDAVNGSSGNDRLSGGSGNDSINGSFGADRVFAGSGNDAINVATAGRRATVSCGSGRDKVRFNNEEKRKIRSDCEIRYEFSDRPRTR